MNIKETYDYLTRARRDLWAALQTVPEEALSKQLLNGDHFHSIKDMLSHIPAVEDGWIHLDILCEGTVWDTIPALKNLKDGEFFDKFSLESLLDYWQKVEKSTLNYLAKLNEEELRRIVSPSDAPDEKLTVDGILWHMMLHEIRHTAQICVLLRTQGIKPPSLDLLFYLPGKNN